MNKSTESGHWYSIDGLPAHEQPKKDGSGMTPTTLRHARKLNLIPSVTTILKILDKPALTNWKIEQAVLAVLTTPQLPNEPLDAYCKRVLETDKVQDEARDAAAKLGTAIHQAIEDALNGRCYLADYDAYVQPVLAECAKFGKLIATEKVIVGQGYAGRVDAIFDNNEVITVVDFKTTKKLPKESYDEHKLQLAAYGEVVGAPITANIYISTANQGEIAVCENDVISIKHAFEAFMNIVKVWQWKNNYVPEQ